MSEHKIIIKEFLAMANEENLKPARSKKEARERGKNGGIASGKARRKKKDLIACLKKHSRKIFRMER